MAQCSPIALTVTLRALPVPVEFVGRLTDSGLQADKVEFDWVKRRF
jgi:hypothetical protein